MYGSRIEFDPNPNVASHQMIGPSPKRVSITFFPPAVGTAWLSNQPMTAQNQGIPFAAGEPPKTFTVGIHGELVTQSWHAVYTMGATPVSWIQALG